MTDPYRYDRKVSAEEATTDQIMVTKDRLAFFPAVGRPFTLLHGGRRLTSRVEAHPCECRGPESPHEHYFIRWIGLQAGDRVTISSDRHTQARYTISIHRS